MTPTRRKLLLVGWDAADWKVITPLMNAGHMPTLRGLVERGVAGNIATLDPPLSPMLWTSIATGKTADEHGVLGFVQPDEKGERIVPVRGTTRKSKAVWNILNQEGLRSNVVGWWPSQPVEHLRGGVVSDQFHRAVGPVDAPWSVSDGSVSPPEWADALAKTRVHPQELTGNHLLPFVPGAAEIDVAKDNNLGLVAKTIAEAATIHGAATWIMEQGEWDLTAVYYDAIDHFGHGFMRFHPPRRPHVNRMLYDRYSGVVTAGYRFHDMMLARLVELAGPDATVMLLSDHGFHSDHLRPTHIPSEPAGPAHEHRDQGVFVLAGPGIQHGQPVHGLSLLDIAPTVLTLFGLPIGRDMPGRPIVEAFETPPAVTYIDSWESVDGESGMHPADVRNDPWAEQEALRQLVELGYVESGDKAQTIDEVMRESDFYLARVHLSRGRPEEALPLLETSHARDPDVERYGLRLVEAYRKLGRHADAHRVLEEAADARRRSYLGRADAAERAADRADALADDPDAEALTPKQVPIPPEELRRRATGYRARAEVLRGKAEHTPAGLHYHRGLLLLEEGRTEEALAELNEAMRSIASFPRLHLRIGEAYLRLKRWDEAEAAFRAMLALDPDAAAAYHGIATAYVNQRRSEEAIEAALEAVGREYFYPAAHAQLGRALQQLGRFEDAAQAFEVAVAQSPGMKKIHFFLSEIYRIHLDDPVAATRHLRFATESVD